MYAYVKFGSLALTTPKDLVSRAKSAAAVIELGILTSPYGLNNLFDYNPVLWLSCGLH